MLYSSILFSNIICLIRKFQCDCAPKMDCPMQCPNNNNSNTNFIGLHDNMMKMAMNDAYNQQDLAQKAKLQVLY